jgi:hypothetical protein
MPTAVAENSLAKLCSLLQYVDGDYRDPVTYDRKDTH